MNTRTNISEPGAKRVWSLILVLFFLSGACGLVYEVVWTRMLIVVFGTTVFAASTVLAAFMAGMALGSFTFGRFADRHGHPLRLYGPLEIGIESDNVNILSNFLFSAPPICGILL